MHKFLILGLILWGFSLQANAQSYTLAEGSSCSVSGTSNISDWTATVTEMELQVVLADNFFDDTQVASDGRVTSASLTIPVKAIDGGKGEAMNDNILEAFDEASNPQIIFQLQNGKVISGSNEAFQLEIEGILSMAGQNKAVKLIFQGAAEGDRLQFTGQHTI
ncbi:MAG: YceI family protein, partial [Bacteroidota bacterium]